MHFLCLLLFASGVVLANTAEKNETVTPAVPSSAGPAHNESSRTTSSEDKTHSPTISTTHGSSTEPSKTSNDHPAPPKTTVTRPTSAPTTVKPKPKPEDHVGNWSLYYHNSTVPCIRILGIIQLNITETQHNKTDIYDLFVPPKAHVTGLCEAKHPSIRFHIDPVKNETLQFTFALNKTAHPESFWLDVIDGEVSFPNNATGKIGFREKVNAFVTPLNNSYKCGTSANFTLKNASKAHVELILHNFQLQAFKNSTNDFDTAVDGCPPAHVTPDIVPIVVGCALAVLVVSVLVAYLISRRRSQARGYLSM